MQGLSSTYKEYTHHLNRKAKWYLSLGLAPTTRATYSTGWQKFTKFCTTTKNSPLPASEQTLLLFVSSLAVNRISHGTIKVYLSAIRHMHVKEGLHSHFSQQVTPRLQLTINGIKKSQVASFTPRVRLPITMQLMQKIQTLLQQSSSYDSKMLWAACCLAFFGFLRVSEFTVPNQEGYDESMHLSLKDISLDNRSNPRLIKVVIKQSKTDPFRKGVYIYLGATDLCTCPVTGMLPYLAVRGTRPGPLFVTEKGMPLTRQIFSSKIDNVLMRLHIDPIQYNTHSFWIDATTTAAQACIADYHIKTLGRWKSDAFQRYIKMPPQELAGLSCQLASVNLP